MHRIVNFDKLIQLCKYHHNDPLSFFPGPLSRQLPFHPNAWGSPVCSSSIVLTLPECYLNGIIQGVCVPLSLAPFTYNACKIYSCCVRVVPFFAQQNSTVWMYNLFIPSLIAEHLGCLQFLTSTFKVSLYGELPYSIISRGKRKPETTEKR